MVSPLIGNAFLHYVLDRWFVETVQPRLRRGSQPVRSAYNCVMTFAGRLDGQRVLAVLGKRLARYGLSLHATNTHVVNFRRPPGAQDRGPGASIDFLTFTHVWGRSRRAYGVRQFTAKQRMARSLNAVSEWCKRHRHARLDRQQARLASVIRGHCNYYGSRGTQSD